MPAPESHKAALLQQKCPRCHTGDVYKYPAYSLKFTQMYEHCPHCGQKYEIEPGFFYGAMYISYGITVVIGLVVMVGANFLLKDPEIWIYLTLLTLSLLILSPVNFRYSRLFMLYWFGSVDYDPKLRKNN
ncbi:MAG: DUF983 domain-containing protein [Sphingobacteriales bacterium]|nr:MAG: DUF983 domain-containing protein [Sphingobacteriales bacterium]